MALADYRRRFIATGGRGREIWFREREWQILHDAGQVPLPQRARLEALMDYYCDYGPLDMNEKMFKFLEHYQARGRTVRLEEFKAKSVRLFGFSRSHGGRTKFFVTGIDVAKKQRRADQSILSGAGNEAIRIIEAIE